jgi:hypothetical protein
MISALSSVDQLNYRIGSAKVQLERKEDMKARGLASPDLGDCLAMTFAVKVLPAAERQQRPPLIRKSCWS